MAIRVARIVFRMGAPLRSVQCSECSDANAASFFCSPQSRLLGLRFRSWLFGRCGEPSVGDVDPPVTTGQGWAAMILLIDNYDSFTFNLFHFLGDVGARCEVWRNDKITVADALAREPEAIVLSPGPCTPNEAGICLDLIAAAAGKVPILGVCLGHQAVGQAFGGNVVRAPVPMHGKVSRIFHAATDILEGLPSPF